jgi:integrase
MPNRFYAIDRPKKKEKLPEVLSKAEIQTLIRCTRNIKHKCIISLIYSAGLRVSELIYLKIKDIDSERMVIRIEDSKGGKDRYSILSRSLLPDLRDYYRQYRPKEFLFEGQNGGKYTPGSVRKIIKQAATKG